MHALRALHDTAKSCPAGTTGAVTGSRDHEASAEGGTARPTATVVVPSADNSHDGTDANLAVVARRRFRSSGRSVIASRNVDHEDDPRVVTMASVIPGRRCLWDPRGHEVMPNDVLRVAALPLPPATVAVRT
jgi:hypothetical protein